MRSFVRAWLACSKRKSDFQVIGTAGTVSLALEMLGPSRPDVVLLDVDLGPQRPWSSCSKPGRPASRVGS